MDDLDRKMLAVLSTDARMSVSALAAQLGVARTTAQARLERLERSGVIAGYAVRLNPDVTAGHIRATVLLQVEPRALVGLLARLRKTPQVELAHTTSGRFDLALQLRANTTTELDQVLDEIGLMQGVRGSESLIHLSTRIERTL